MAKNLSAARKSSDRKGVFLNTQWPVSKDFHVMAKPTALSAISIAPTAMASKRNLFSLKARMTNWRKLCKLLKINVISDL